MKYLFLCLMAFLFPTLGGSGVDVRVFEEPGNEEPAKKCNGCTNKPADIVGAGAVHFDITYVGRRGGRSPGHRQLPWEKGDCRGDKAPCESDPCTLGPGTLSIRNTEFSRPITVTLRRSGGVVGSHRLQPKEHVLLTFGDPTTGTAEDVQCGGKTEIEVSAVNPSSGAVVSVTLAFVCRSCGFGDEGNKDPTEPVKPARDP